MTVNRFAGDRVASAEGSQELSDALGGATTALYVDVGSTAKVPDGTLGKPFKTVAAAFAAITAPDVTVFVAPGSYEETVAIVWPLYTGIKLVGVGSVSVRGAAGVTALSIVPGVVAATFEATIQDIELAHRTGTIGLFLDNTAMTKKLNVYLRNVDIEQEGSGNAIDTVHGDAANAIRIYASGRQSEIEGLVNIDIGNDGDRIRFTNYMLSGGITTSADAIVSEITIKLCQLKHEGVAGGNGSQVFNSIRSWTLTGVTYAAVDTTDLGGSHTEVII